MIPGMSPIDDEPWLTLICADCWTALIYGRWTTVMAIDDDRSWMTNDGRWTTEMVVDDDRWPAIEERCLEIEERWLTDPWAMIEDRWTTTAMMAIYDRW
jgi:hypothetical protein